MSPTIYLDNAATSWPKPPQVMAAMHRFYEQAGGSPGRAGHARAVATYEIVHGVRVKLARLLGVDEPERMIHTLNGTDALNMAIKGVVRPGDHVIATAADHNSIRRPLNAMARDGMIDLTIAPVDAVGFVDPDDIRTAITPKTRLISCLHAGNVVGAIQPAEQIGRIAREHDCIFLLDAAQSIGVLDVNVPALFADLVAFPCHKSLLGPGGTGALYVGPRVLIKPWREGGTGADSESPTQPTEFPTWLEAGSPNTVGIAGLSAALDVADPVATLMHERKLVARLWRGLDGDDRFVLYGSTDLDRRVGVVSVNIVGMPPVDAAAALDRSFGIASRPGLHCAPLMHRAIGTHPEGTVRFSLGRYTTASEIDQLLDALQEIATPQRHRGTEKNYRCFVP